MNLQPPSEAVIGDLSSDLRACEEEKLEKLLLDRLQSDSETETVIADVRTELAKRRGERR